MKTSQRGINDLVASEGLRTVAYTDSVGVLTIGVGHTAAAGEPKPVRGMTITRQQALDILAKDLAKYEATVNAILPNVPQHVFDGAVSFHFNTGGIARATWPKLYKAGKLKEAKSSFLTWNKPPEIKKRRQREADLIFNGIYATPAVAEPASAPPAAPEPVPVPPPPDIPAPDPEAPSPAPEGGVSVSVGAAAVIVGGGLTTAAAAIDRWQVWLGLGVCIAFAAFVAVIVFRNQKD